MKRFFTATASLVILLTGCRTAQTQQNEPQVISAPAGGQAEPSSTAPLSTPSPEATPPFVAPAQPTITPAAPLSSSSARTNKLSYSSCYVDGPYIAITFDDGPSAELTPKLLDMLKQRGIKATFFMVGECVVQHPEIVQRMVREGHEVGNHSWSHLQLTKLGADSFRKQMANTNDAIIKACGVKPVVMRPPYGATNTSLDKIINSDYGMKVILWSIDPLDWKYRSAQRVHDQIVNAIHPGAIILAHDIHASTVAAMPQTLDDLTARGYQFVTVSELIAMDRPLPPPTATPVPTMVPRKASPSVSPQASPANP